MTIYGGIAPGTFQAWELNLPDDALLQAGIARGLQVGQNSPIGMSVVVGVDASSGDGIAFMPSGAWIDTNAAITLTVSNNGGASPRTDAVVATSYQNVSTSPSIVYTNNWTGGFAGGTSDQLVLALVTVPVSSSGITTANIQQNTAIASSYNSLLAVNSLNLTSGGVWWTGTSGVYMTMTHNPDWQSGVFQTIAPVGTTNQGIVLAWTDTSAVQHFGLTVTMSGTPMWFGAPMLAGGNQDTGRCGIQGVASGAGQFWGNGVSFHQKLQNVPSGVILTSKTQSNIATVQGVHLDQYGFDFLITSAGSGNFWWLGTYSTSGN